MRRFVTTLLVLCLPVPLLAAERLWTEKTAEEAKRDQVVLPTLAPLIKRAGAAVVNISTDGKMPQLTPGHPMPEGMEEFFKRFHGEIPKSLLKGLGTGFIIHPTGYILTNNHVVEDSDLIEVRLADDDVPHKAKIVGTDEATDLALIKIDGADLPVLPLGDSETLEVGDFVLAIGSPFGLANSASFGMVSAKGRREVNPSGRTGLFDFVQTDAAINPGNSGGPLINLRGEVVGINAAINTTGQGIGFAIPINMAKMLLPELKEKGKVTRAWLGVSIQKVTPELAQSFGLEAPRGALISNVLNEGPGQKAGLEPGDVITEFDGKKVIHSVDLPLMAAVTGVGKTVDIKFIRDGKPKSGKVTLTARPEESALQADAGSQRSNELGVAVGDLDADTRSELGLPDGFKGAVVKDVVRKSPAASAGLKAGDVIVKVNGKAVDGAKGFQALTRGLKEGQLARLFIRRGDTGMFVAVKAN